MVILHRTDLQNEAFNFQNYNMRLLGRRRQANLCFHFAGSGENLPDIAKSRDASMDNKEFSSLLQILMK